MESSKSKLCSSLNKKKSLLKLLRTQRIIIWFKLKELPKDKVLILIKHMSTQHNWLVRLLTLLRTTEMIYNSKFHLTAKTMLFISEQYTWVHQLLNQQELFLIQEVNIWLSPQSFVTMKPQVTINLRNTTHFKVVSFKEIKCTKDARLWLTICINLTLTKSYLRLHLS